MRILLPSLLALAILMTGCGTVRPDAGSTSGQMVGPMWRLVAIGTDAVPADAGVTLTFGADGQVSGSSGCNLYSGQVQRGADGTLTVSPLLSTLRACGPPEAEIEGVVLPAIQGADRAVIVDGDLVLTGVTPLRFTADAMSSASLSGTLSGTVTYRQRIALPPDAVVTVRLLDVSLADAPSVTLAEQTIETDGNQVPLPYALTFDPARIEARRRYVVRAEIRDADGALRWTTETAIPVLTRDAPTDGVEIQVVQVN